MDKRTYDIWNDDDGAEEEGRKKSRRLRRFLIFLLVLVVVLGIVALAAWRDGTGFDALRRYFSYGSAESSSGSETYRYDASSANRFALLDDTLVVLSDTSLRLVSQGGEEVWSTSIRMSTPALESAGNWAVAYDVGGTQILVVNRDGQVLQMETGENDLIISVSLSEDGYLAVTAEKKNYKGCVSVYDLSGELLFAFNSSQRFVVDACSFDGGQRLAAVTLGQENSVFVSNVVLYNLKETGGQASSDGTGVEIPSYADYDITNGLILEIAEREGTLLSVTDTSLDQTDAQGENQWSYSYQGEYLREYDLGGDSFTALLLNRYRSGSVGRLVTVGEDGAELASLDVNEEVVGISAAGRYLAVLYTDELVIYTPELETYATLVGTGAAVDVIQREDGSALLLSADSAQVFLP